PSITQAVTGTAYARSPRSGGLSVGGHTVVRMQQSWTGEVLRTTEGEVRQGRLPAPRLPGERVVGSLREAGREATYADLATQEVSRLQEDELRSGLAAAAWVASALLRARVRLACEV